MLNFGLKRIFKKLVVANAIWIFVILIIEAFRLNTYNNVLEGKICIPDFWMIYCIPTLILIGYDFFYQRIIRLEVKDNVLLLTGLKFFLVHTLKIRKENTSYTITIKKGFRSKHMRCLRVYDGRVEKYFIQEYDLSAVEMDQAIAFFRSHLPVSVKMEA